MKKETLTTILLVCVLVLSSSIAILAASDIEDESGESESVATHSHTEYVNNTGDTMTGDLYVPNLYASGIYGDGDGLTNLNADNIASGTIDTARLPPLDADTLDGMDSMDFAMAAHDHEDSYYTKTESDSKYAPTSHNHPPADADTLDDLDSTDFALSTHTHPPGDADTLDSYDSTDFAMAAHTHDLRYYLRSEVDMYFLNLSGGTLTGDLNLSNLYASGVVSGDGSSLTNLNASYISTGTIDLPRLPSNIDADTLDTFDSTDFAMAAHTHDDIYYNKTESDARYALSTHTHDASDITSGILSPDTIPMINGSKIEDGGVLSEDIADGNVTTAKLENNAVIQVGTSILTSNTTTGSSTWVPIDNVEVILETGDNQILIWGSWSGTISSGPTGCGIAIEIDGIVEICTTDFINVQSQHPSGNIVYATNVSAGLHTIKLLYKIDLGNLYIKPLDPAEGDHANLIVMELKNE